MTNPTYAQKLKDPRWQKMRLEVLQKADFKCTDCDDETSTLHVHHTEYVWGKNPWEYDPDTLVCLCEACHAEQIGENVKTILRGASYERTLRLSNLIESIAFLVTTKDRSEKRCFAVSAIISSLELHSPGKSFSPDEFAALVKVEEVFNL